jgi:hypothetical protein
MDLNFRVFAVERCGFGFDLRPFVPSEPICTEEKKIAWLVSFMDYDLGYIDLEERTLQPLNNPFGPKV